MLLSSIKPGPRRYFPRVIGFSYIFPPLKDGEKAERRASGELGRRGDFG